MESQKTENESILYNLNIEDIFNKVYSNVEEKIDYLNKNYVKQNLEHLNDKKEEHEKMITEKLIILKDLILENYNDTKLTLIEKSEKIKQKFIEFLNNEQIIQSREFLKLKIENLLDLLKNIIEKNMNEQDIEYKETEKEGFNLEDNKQNIIDNDIIDIDSVDNDSVDNDSVDNDSVDNDIVENDSA